MGSSRSFLFADICKASTPTIPAAVGPANDTQLLTWKSLWLYDLELSANVVCLMLAPRLTEVTTWKPYLFRNTSYHFQEFFSQGFSIFFGSFSKSLIKLLDKLAVVSRQSLSTTIFLVNALTFKDIPLTLDSFDCTCYAALLNVTPSVKLDCSEGSKPASVATFQ